MLREASELHGTTVHAMDGEIGRVDEILFDDGHWTVRYLIADTGSWLLGRKVLISPPAFGSMDWTQHTLDVKLTRRQVEESPGVETDRPVSRQWEKEFHDYYSWPYYWAAMGEWGASYYAGGLLAQPFEHTEQERQQPEDPERELMQSHLRSTKEVTGYSISATDGHLGHVDDFIVDDETWRICYLAVDTRDWWPGKRVLLPPEWIGNIQWPERSVSVSVTRDQVRNVPEWDPGQPISRTYENQMLDYYARQRPTNSERPGESARSTTGPDAPVFPVLRCAEQLDLINNTRGGTT